MNATDIAGLQDLRVEIGGRALVDGVSLRLVPGKITALIGASGSGKTTTGLALLHEYPPGAVVTGEVNVPDALIGYVPQHPATVLNPARPVAALLQDIARTQVRHLPRRARRSAVRHRVLRALDRAQLPDGETLLHRYPHQLSGGQQQRVVLAQALLTGATHPRRGRTDHRSGRTDEAADHRPTRRLGPAGHRHTAPEPRPGGRPRPGR